VYIHNRSCDLLNCECPHLSMVDCYKYLGVYIDSKLSWSEHISHIMKRLRLANVMLYKLQNAVHPKISKIVYFAFAQSYLQYCISSYGSAFRNVLDPLIKLQKQSIRLVTKSNRLCPTASLFFNEQVLSFSQLYYYNCVCFLKKNETYIANNLVKSRSIRQSSFVRKTTFTSTRGQHSFAFRSANFLNFIKGIELLS